MLSDAEYQTYVDRLASQELKIGLSRTPTTMGPGYIAEKIAEILDAKSVVNEMSEKVELALCDAEVRLNDLEEEVQLRTHIEYENLRLDPNADELKNSKSRDSYVWTHVEQGYIDDHQAEFEARNIQVTGFQLSEDLRQAKSDIIKLKTLLRIIDHRRDELGKLDSGVRLQQKTMETEAAIYGKSGIPQPATTTNGSKVRVDVGFTPRDVDESEDPDALVEDFGEMPPPIDEEEGVPY